MATLSVWKYDTPEGAQEAQDALVALAKQELVQIRDSAIVSWEVGKAKPKTKQGVPTTGAGALGGAFWGLLFGLIFFVPLIGAAIGAASGALAGALTDVGINDDFIKSVRGQVQPGTSALFLMTSGAVMDRLKESLAEQGIRGTLLQTNLSAEDEAKLRAAFGDEG